MFDTVRFDLFTLELLTPRRLPHSPTLSHKGE